MFFRVLKCVFGYLTPLFFVVACSTVVQTPATTSYSPEVMDVLSGRKLIGHNVVTTELPDLDLFGITPEMAAFAEKAVGKLDRTYDKVQALHHAILGSVESGGLGLSYNTYSTDTPINTFKKRQANCLSFTLLYVALAKHVDINAKVNEVQIPPTWDFRSRNSLVFLRHVNVHVSFRTTATPRALKAGDAIIDLEMQRYKSTYPQHIISDDLTAAQFYSNRGMELLADKKPVDAFLYIRTAILKNDQQSYIWNNLGSLYNREGFLHESEIAYLHGLEINHDDLSIMTNLAGLYKKMNNNEQAAVYSKLAQNHLKANPYYQYNLALTAFDEGDNENALRYVKLALDREQKEPRFYELAATVYQNLGKTSEAAIMAKKRKVLLDRGG